MQRNTAALVIIALVVGFIGGFWLANSINRSSMTSAFGAGAGQSNANSALQPVAADDDLTPQEVDSKIAEADTNPGNFAFQKSLGIGLYRYAAMKSDLALLAESVRLLTRAKSQNAKDFDVLVALGNAHFDIGYASKNPASFETARSVYTQALAVRPGDSDVRADVGISYYVQDPPDYKLAAAELEAVGKSDPKHDRSMQFLVQVYLKQSRIEQAENVLSKIKEINPANPAIANLTSEIAAARRAKQ